MATPMDISGGLKTRLCLPMEKSLPESSRALRLSGRPAEKNAIRGAKTLVREMIRVAAIHAEIRLAAIHRDATRHVEEDRSH